MPADPLLVCESVRKSFGSRGVCPALLDVSFSVRSGEQLCITGASGSGKTTLLSIVAGLQRPTSGDVKIMGRSLLTMKPGELAALRAHEIGLVFQAASLIPVLSARENIEYPLRIAKPRLSQKERSLLIDEALALTNLEDQQHLRPGELSGGECQRVSIARAVVKRPPLVLADEPTSHLDDNNTSAICRIFEQLQYQYHSTIVIATHDARILALRQETIRLRFRGEASQPASWRGPLAEIAQ